MTAINAWQVEWAEPDVLRAFSPQQCAVVAGHKMQGCNSGMCSVKPACVQLRLHVLHLSQTCRQDLMHLRTAATTMLFLLSNPKALLPHQHPCPADNQLRPFCQQSSDRWNARAR